MRNQQQWIRRQLKDPNVRILDMGPDPKRPLKDRSKYYLEEMKYSKKYAGYERKNKAGCH
jgi:cytochrome oxidase Cu insertion factor (SCO1/SenC/PrrC family)